MPRTKTLRAGRGRLQNSDVIATNAGNQCALIGRRIRDLRVGVGMTLAELSRTTELSIGYLSQLERGLVSPTVRTLYTVGSVLGVAPAWLIDPSLFAAESGEDAFIMRANKRRSLLESGGVRKEIASPAASRRLQSFFMMIEPGCSSRTEPYFDTIEEIGLILTGTIELRIDEQSFTLNEGDCFAFESKRSHQFANSGPCLASVFWVNVRNCPELT